MRVRDASDPLHLIFVGTRRGNAFMNELLDAIAFEVQRLGVSVETTFDGFSDVDDAVFVVIPHEYFSTVPRAQHPRPAQLRRTIALCVEQPGTPWFETSVKHARRAAAAVDINRLGRDELRRRGIAAEHFQIGYTSRWDTWHGEPRERPVDVMHLGTEAPRRLQALSLYAADLWARESRLLLPTVERKTRGKQDYLTGPAKWRALGETRILLNLHRQPLAYFEWVRVLEAMCNGCVVVSEASRGAAPLVVGEHYVAGRLASLGMLADGLLSDEPALAAMREAAYSFIRGSLPMSASAARLAEVAAKVSGGKTSTTVDLGAIRRVGKGAGVVGRRLRRLVRPAPPVAAEAVLEHTMLGELQRARTIQKRLLLGQIGLGRALQRLESQAAGMSSDEPVEIARSAAYTDASPRVTVIIPLHNHAHDVTRALRSVARSSSAELEVVVLDDASTDLSRDAVLGFMERHATLPSILLGHSWNRGLGATRNSLVRAARGKFVLPLDADNELYPTAVAKLVRALDADPDALFAYPILEVHVEGVPVTLLGSQPWEPTRLRWGNYIDALALLRRDELVALGGYTEDIRLYGWEDYDLWCRAAAHGLRGVHVPEILARYASGEHSMLSLTNIDDTEARALLRLRYPAVFVHPSRRHRVAS